MGTKTISQLNADSNLTGSELFLIMDSNVTKNVVGTNVKNFVLSGATITGGTYSSTGNTMTFTNNTGGTFNVTGITEYTYIETIISSSTLINPPSTEIGNNGIILLSGITTGQYYEWKMNIEFIPSTITYSGPITDVISVAGNLVQYPSLTLGDVIQNQNLIWQLSSRSGMQSSFTISAEGAGPSSNYLGYLGLFWPIGAFTNGNGSIKVKLWYKISTIG